MAEATAEVQDVRMVEEEHLQAENESTQPRDNTTATEGKEQKWLQERERRRERSREAKSDKKRNKTGSAGKEKREKTHEEKEEQDRIRKEKEDQRQQWRERRAKSKFHKCGQLGHYKCKCRNRAPPRRLQQQPVYNFHEPCKLFINKE